MSKRPVFLGAGGHAKVLLEMARQQHFDVKAVIAPDKPMGPQFSGIPHFESDDVVSKYPVTTVELVNALGSLPLQNNHRVELYAQFSALGFTFATILSPKASVSGYAVLSEGVQVFPGATINCCDIGANSIVNTGAIVEHDVSIGRHCHIAPGAVLCGDVRLEDNVHIGAGATVIQGVSIGYGAVIGAGSVVTRNILAHSVHYPARPFTRRDVK